MTFLRPLDWGTKYSPSPNAFLLFLCLVNNKNILGKRLVASAKAFCICYEKPCSSLCSQSFTIDGTSNGARRVWGEVVVVQTVVSCCPFQLPQTGNISHAPTIDTKQGAERASWSDASCMGSSFFVCVENSVYVKVFVILAALGRMVR